MSHYKTKAVASICLILCLFYLSGCLSSTSTTTVYLVRHTEKDLSQETDPPLTDAGKQRAEQWAKLLQHEKIVSVFSTDTARTRDTAAAIATNQGVEVTLYPAKSVSREDLLAGHEGKAIVVVGHSNTVPSIVNKLMREERYSDLSEDDYDSLFIVDVRAGDSGSATSKRLIVPLAKY